MKRVPSYKLSLSKHDRKTQKVLSALRIIVAERLELKPKYRNPAIENMGLMYISGLLPDNLCDLLIEGGNTAVAEVINQGKLEEFNKFFTDEFKEPDVGSEGVGLEQKTTVQY